MGDDLRARLVATLDQPDQEWFGMIRRNPAEEAIPLALPRLAEARAIAEELARRHPSTRVRVHALQLWPRLCVFDPAAGAGTFRPGLGDDRLAGFRAAALELTRDPDPAVRAAAAIQVLTFAEHDMLPAIRAELGPRRLDREVRDHAEQWGAGEALRRLEGPPGAIAALRRALATEPPIVDAELVAAIQALVDAPEPEAAPLLARLWPGLPAIRDRRAPARVEVAPGAPVLDPASAAAVATITAWTACASPLLLPGFPALLAAAAPPLAAVIVQALAHHGRRGADALALAARDPALVQPVRIEAIASLATAARLDDAAAEVAREVAAALAADPVVAAAARRLATELSTRPA